MSKSCFTLGEANDMLPLVERTLSRVFQMRRQLEQIQRELELANAAPEEEDFEVLFEDASMGVVNRRAALKTLLATIDDEIENLANAGAILRDIDEGRIDWRACHDGRDIHLCWQQGESEVAHWHDADDGCTTRNPLDELDPDVEP
jgi:hypothetical protein